MLSLAAAVIAAAEPASMARAQTTEGARDVMYTIDSRIIQVVSGGNWTDETRNGQYRVVVASDGKGETVHYTAILQWLVRRGLTQEVHVVHSIDIRTIAPRFFSMIDPEIKEHEGKWELHLNVSDGPQRPATSRAKFELGAPGQIHERN